MALCVWMCVCACACVLLIAFENRLLHSHSHFYLHSHLHSHSRPLLQCTRCYDGCTPALQHSPRQLRLLHLPGYNSTPTRSPSTPRAHRPTPHSAYANTRAGHTARLHTAAAHAAHATCASLLASANVSACCCARSTAC